MEKMEVSSAPTTMSSSEEHDTASSPSSKRTHDDAVVPRVYNASRLQSISLSWVPSLTTFAPIMTATETHEASRSGSILSERDKKSRRGSDSGRPSLSSYLHSPEAPIPSVHEAPSDTGKGPPPTLDVCVVRETSEDIFPTFSVARTSLAEELHAHSTKDAAPAQTGEPPSPPLVSLERVHTVTPVPPDGASDVPVKTTTALNQMRDVNMVPERCSDSAASCKLQSAHTLRTPPPRPEAAMPSPRLTEAEELRIAKSVEETVRLNFRSASLSHPGAPPPHRHSQSSSSGGSANAVGPMASSTASGIPTAAGVLLGRACPKAEPPQMRLGSRFQPRLSVDATARRDETIGSPPRRPHSTHGRMSSVEHFLSDGSHTSAQSVGMDKRSVANTNLAEPTPRLFLAKLGRPHGSSDELTGEDVHSSSRPGDDAWDAEVSELFGGYALWPTELTEQPASRSPRHSIPSTLPTGSPVGILYKSYSLFESSANSIPDLSSAAPRPEDAKASSEENDGGANASSAASPVHGMLMEDVNRHWSTCRSRRSSRSGRALNGRDTPRAVGFIGDEVAEAELDSPARHELNKKRILEKMRSRRTSTTPNAD